MTALNTADLTRWLTAPGILPAIASIVVGVLSVAGVLLAIYYSRRVPSIDRYHAKRLALIDITKKRLDVQELLLKVGLSAAGRDKEARDNVGHEARAAVAKIVSDADLSMKRLEWRSQIRRAMAKKSHKLHPKNLNRGDKFFYWVFRLMSWILRLLGGFLYLYTSWRWHLVAVRAGEKSIPIQTQIHALVLLFVAIGIFAFGYFGFLRLANELKYPKPDEPILDEI